MNNKTIVDVKTKLVNAVYEIDTGKLTLMDLKLLADTVSVISNINDNPFDFMKALSEIQGNGFGMKSAKISELKDGE